MWAVKYADKPCVFQHKHLASLFSKSVLGGKAKAFRVLITELKPKRKAGKR